MSTKTKSAAVEGIYQEMVDFFLRETLGEDGYQVRVENIADLTKGLPLDLVLKASGNSSRVFVQLRGELILLRRANPLEKALRIFSKNSSYVKLNPEVAARRIMKTLSEEANLH